MTKTCSFKLVAFFALLFFSTAAFSQDSETIPFDDLPPNSEYGKCYAKCRQPDIYETVSRSVLVKEASTKIIKVAAVYENPHRKGFW